MTYPRPVMSPGETLCLLSDLADPGSREFRIATERGPRFAFIVRKGDAVYGYMNRCPHIGATMDYKIDEFLTRDRQRIECSYHGAEFRIEDGFCVLGPCEGQKLVPVALCLEDGRVILAT